MSLKLRFSFLFTLLAGSILFLFASLIYFSAANDRRNEFFNLLQKEALTRANLLLGAKVDAEILQTIYLSNREVLNEVEVAIYDPYFNLLYHDAVEIDFVKETPEMIDEILKRGEIRFVQERWEVIGMVFNHNDKTYVITAAAFDEYGHTKLRNLLNNLILYWLAGVVLVFAAGWYFARRALKPVSSMVQKAGDITATNLDLRLNQGNGKDELSRLAATFNLMLDRLQNSFEAQKEFVSNIAHELRTPLAAISGEAELALSQKKSTKEYEEAIEKIYSDSRKLSKLITGLLDLARASYDKSNIKLAEIRLDEILLDARNDLLKTNQQYHIDLSFDDQSSDENPFVIIGNEYLLRVALINLMDNACKFSENQTARVQLKRESSKLIASVEDQGVGISNDDLNDIFKPFYRGRNKTETEGCGIGLPLTKRIVELHGGKITVLSKPERGTRAEIAFSIEG